MMSNHASNPVGRNQILEHLARLTRQAISHRSHSGGTYENHVPAYLGSDGRCFACGERPAEPPEVNETLALTHATVRFLVCSDCLALGVDVHHARRTYLREVSAWLSKVDGLRPQ